MDTFKFSSCVRGHHVKETVWTPVLGEKLECRRAILMLLLFLRRLQLLDTSLEGFQQLVLSFFAVMALQVQGTTALIYPREGLSV